MDTAPLDVRMALLASMEARGFDWGLSAEEIIHTVPDLDQDLDRILASLQGHIMERGGVFRLTTDGFRAIWCLDGWPRYTVVAALRNELGRVLADWVASNGTTERGMPLGLVRSATIGASALETEAAIVQANLLGWVRHASLERGQALHAGLRIQTVRREIDVPARGPFDALDRAVYRPRWSLIHSLVMRLGPLAEVPRHPSRPASPTAPQPPRRASSPRVPLEQPGTPGRAPGPDGGLLDIASPELRAWLGMPHAEEAATSNAASARGDKGAPVTLGYVPRALLDSRRASEGPRPPATTPTRPRSTAVTPIPPPSQRPLSTAIPAVDRPPPPLRAASEPYWAERIGQLHAALAPTCIEPFMRGDLELAVANARKSLVHAVHDRSKLPGDTRNVFETAFSSRGTVLAVPQAGPRPMASVQDGWKALFCGALEVVHVPADAPGNGMTRQDAFNRLSLVSLLLDVLDRSKRM